MIYREPIKLYYYEVLEYDRKSRSDDPLLSVEEVLEKHGKILEEYAINNLGGPIPEENKYKEIGSAESIDKRSEMLRLLKAIESPAIKAVIVVDVQRLSRGDLEDAGRLIKLLRYTNTYVITPMKTYDLRDEYDRDAFERELKRGNEYLEYYKKIQHNGRLLSVKEGNYLGSVAPYGYERMKIKDGKKDCWTLKEKKDEADVVRLIFDWYCNEQIGTRAICARLESMNIKTNSKSDKWYPTAITSILENEHYIGCVRWNWKKTIKIIEDQEVKVLRPKAKVNEYLIFNGKHDAIISEEMFNRAKEVRKSKPPVKNETSLKNPFSGLIYCKCGAKVGYKAFAKDGVETTPPKLVCNNQVRCKSGSADFREVFDYICESLEDCIGEFKLRVTNNQDDSVKLHTNLIVNMKQKLKDLEAKELAQWDAQYDPDPDKRMPQHIFKMLNERLLQEKEEIKQALCKAEESMPQPIDYKTKIIKFTDALTALKDPNVPTKLKNQYLKDIIERIDYERAPIVRITKENAKRYNMTIGKSLQYHVEPYKIRISLK